MNIEKIVSLCKRRGFVFQSSEVYGGLSSVFDYGPMGVELKRNIKEAWWKANVHQRSDIYGFDAAILMHPAVWKSSGHIDGFADPMIDCRACKKRIRQDQLRNLKGLVGECPECNAKVDIKDTPPRMFNLMLKTFLGAVEGAASVCYLRPETAQGMFVNFINVLDAMHPRLPFGIAQLGKAFRNEVTVGNFIFRMREFEQMEIEYFVAPKDDEEMHKQWVEERFNWYIQLGIRKENLRKRRHEKEELAHYAKACVDIEYKFGFSTGAGTSDGWAELEGIANRQDFDLKEHAKFSGRDFTYFDDESKKRFLPYVIEPSGGVDRSVLAFLCDAYREETVKDRQRVVLGLHKSLAPVKAAILPLLKNRPQVVEMAKRLSVDLNRRFYVMYDDTAAIGKLYRRQDEIGTPYCVTVDVQSLEDGQVTIRDRDTMRQDRIGIEKMEEYLDKKLSS